MCFYISDVDFLPLEFTGTSVSPKETKSYTTVRLEALLIGLQFI